jgi:hypothetical protein
MRNYAGSAMMLVTTMVAAVGCYTINLKVSGERAGVESLRRQLVADAREMRNLQAELRTRARFPELQRWNDNVLQMSAPAAGQFLRSPVELAGYAAAPVAAKPGIVYAVTTPEAAVPVTAPLVTVVYAAPAAADTAAPRLIRAGYVAPQRAPSPVVELATPTPRRAPVVEIVPPERAQKVRPERTQLARAEPRPDSRPAARPAEPRRPELRKAAPAKAEAPRAEATAPGAPIDLLPQEGQ